jgi:RNA polymerase sigma-70 factor (ECF subfamily)
MTAIPDFNRIVSEYEERITRYLTGLVSDPTLAQDLTQETFLRVHRNLERLENPEALTAWIYRIASNLVRDHLRSRASGQEARTASLDVSSLDDEGEAPEMANDDVSAEGRLEQEEMAACIRGYIAKLPGALRACLMLRDLEGLDEKAVADILGCSVAAVKVRTHRARKKLRAVLREGCDFYQDELGVLRCEPAETSNPSPTQCPSTPNQPKKE